MSKQPLGYYYRTRSQITGTPIVLIFTGFQKKSRNSKTGNLIQSWILDEREEPHLAIRTGGDASVCGDCALRPIVGGACYVVTHEAPLAVYRAYMRGSYEPLQLDDLSAFHGRKARIGSYGDPYAVHARFWTEFLKKAQLANATGYTHAWRKPNAWRYRDFLMASVDSPAEQRDAFLRGWSTFRARRETEKVFAYEQICPASPEGGEKAKCETCMACKGARDKIRHRVIVYHGVRARNGGR